MSEKARKIARIQCVKPLIIGPLNVNTSSTPSFEKNVMSIRPFYAKSPSDSDNESTLKAAYILPSFKYYNLILDSKPPSKCKNVRFEGGIKKKRAE